MKVIINNQEIPIQIMYTPHSRAMGMMGKSTLNGGMLFPFDDIGERSFWMKNCIIPLDILFISGNKINHIAHNCPPCDSKFCPSYRGVGDKVLELNGGFCDLHNIKEGDTIIFS